MMTEATGNYTTGSIFQIDNTERLLNTGDVKRACGNPASETWAKYRSTLGITDRTLTRREAFLLFVMAQLCRHKKNVDSVMVYAAAVELLNKSPDIAYQTLKLCGVDGVLGRELAQAIGDATGYYPSERTLYQWGKLLKMPKFGRDVRYSGNQVARFCNRARSMRGSSKQQGSAA